MASSAPTLRPLSCWKALLRRSRQQRMCIRCMATVETPVKSPRPPPPLPSSYPSPYKLIHKIREPAKKIVTYPPPPSTRNKYPEPLLEWTKDHLKDLDPTGSRQRLFAKTNPDTPQPGDIILVTFKTGEPFAGVCLSIRRRGVDTGILLRNRIFMTGVEMWVKIYSPNVKSIELVKRAEKRARRARLYYMRKPKHDRGSVEGEVEQYLKRRRLIRSGALGVKDPKASAKRPESSRSGVSAS
ncbi:hypothetical protein N7G274_006508 [Stereocaulon virgatum]|uniref:Ribosomal protein L19 n=1 Tax=Stereocaulon virgatum TaxID=373712 RepID=A0ABR4A3N5_9LECA